MIFNDDNLQRLVYEELKSRDDFEKFLKESPSFRIRMREVMPNLFPAFSPGTRPEDALELKTIILNLIYLGFRNFFSDWVLNILIPTREGPMPDPTKLSTDAINKYLKEIRQKLRDINPQKYDEIAANLDDYQIVKQFRDLVNKLQKPKA